MSAWICWDLAYLIIRSVLFDVSIEQAGTEQGQAKIKLELGFTLYKISWISSNDDNKKLINIFENFLVQMINLGAKTVFYSFFRQIGAVNLYYHIGVFSYYHGMRVKTIQCTKLIIKPLKYILIHEDKDLKWGNHVWNMEKMRGERANIGGLKKILDGGVQALMGRRGPPIPLYWPTMSLTLQAERSKFGPITLMPD